jgi:hypothetical protein
MGAAFELAFDQLACWNSDGNDGPQTSIPLVEALVPAEHLMPADGCRPRGLRPRQAGLGATNSPLC